MTPEEYQRVREVFALVHDAPPGEVDVALRAACDGDDALHAQVRALLAVDERAAGFMTVPDAPPDAPDVFDASSLPEIPGYTVRRRIAVGGMGEVFEAEQHDPRRTVAIKVVRSGAASLDRFRNEIQILARLSHPGIAKVYASGTVTIGGSELPYFAMEFIHGEPITAYAREHQLDHAQRVALLARVCDAVEHAHRAGVLHRDLKPPNILVDADGAPHVLDFGVARATDGDSTRTLHTRPGQLIGTLPYMSPEQVAGVPDAIDHTCDVYALGVVLYELLADRLPLDVLQTSLADAARIITEEEPTRLGTVERSLRGDLETIVGKAMEKEKARRYLSAAALAADLRRSLASEPIEAHPPSALYQLRTFARRHRAIVNGVLATFLVLTIGIITTTIVAFSAISNAREASFGSYRSRIAAAQSALALDDPTAARVHLDAAPADLRDWEWRYLLDVADPTSAQYQVEGPLVPAAFAFDSTDTPLHLRLRADALEVVSLRDPVTVHQTLLPAATGRRALAPGATHAAAIDPDTRMLHLWSLGDDAAQHLGRIALDGLSAPIGELLFSNDGSTLAVVTRETDATIMTVDVASATITMTRTVTALARIVLSEDGSQLLYISTAAPSSFAPIGIVDVTTGTMRQLILESVSHVDSAVAFSPDGTTIAVGLDQFARRIVLLDAATLTPVGELSGHQFAVSGVCFSRDGRRVASISEHVILVHDLETRAIVSTSSIPGRGIVRGFVGARAHDEFLVLASDAPQQHVATLVRTARPASQVLRGHQTYVYQLAFDADSRRLASVDYDGRIIVWDVADGRRLQTLDHGSRQSIAFVRDGSAVISDARRFDLETGESALLPVGTPGLDWSPRVPTSIPFSTGVVYECGAISADQAWYVSGVFRKTEYHAGMREIRSVATGEVVQHFRASSSDPVRAAAFSADRTRLAAGRLDGVVEIHDLERETCRHEIPAHTSSVFTVNFSPDGRRLASGGNDNTVRLFDVETGHEVLALRGHTSYVHCVAFSPDGRVLASASGDGTVRLWRAPRPREGDE